MLFEYSLRKFQMFNSFVLSPRGRLILYKQQPDTFYKQIRMHHFEFFLTILDCRDFLYNYLKC